MYASKLIYVIAIGWWIASNRIKYIGIGISQAE